MIHLPANDDVCDESEVRQLTAEVKVPKVTGGKRVLRWDNQGRRNEALDCFVGALAALRISQQRFGLDLDQLDCAEAPAAGEGDLAPTVVPAPRPSRKKTKPAPPAAPPATGGGGHPSWLKIGNDSWL